MMLTMQTRALAFSGCVVVARSRHGRRFIPSSREEGIERSRAQP